VISIGERAERWVKDDEAQPIEIVAKKNEYRSALRRTSRFGFAGVPNALNLELDLLGLLEVALVVASWRVVLICRRRNVLLHCAWLVVRVGVLCCIVVGGDPEPPFSAALDRTSAFGFVVRVSGSVLVGTSMHPHWIGTEEPKDIQLDTQLRPLNDN
jgi:hypothetical protein